MAVIECVPNFSEGRNPEVIRQIASVMDAEERVSVLHIDKGYSANRSVITLAGEPEAVLEAAFQGIKKAAELIDMTKHTGTHPRIGATDVCPMVPVSGISMEETIALANRLGKRVGEELHIPVYLYEHAATRPERRNLATIRKGGFERLINKLRQVDWKPDFGHPPFNEKAGATVIGTRDFLLAYNVNLKTTNDDVAKEIATEVRYSGKLVFDPIANQTVRKRGLLPFVKAIGWYMEEFQIAQVSMNLTNLEVTPIYMAFEKVKELAEKRGVEVTGSELVGLIPLKYIKEAGIHFLKKKGVPHAEKIAERDLIEEAVSALGLNQLHPFLPEKRVLEYAMRGKGMSV